MSGTRSIRIAEFDIWRPGYSADTVRIYVAGTTTLADVFSDPELSSPAENPQTLLTRTDPDGTVLGKFAVPIYVGTPYTLTINDESTTGIQRLPLYDMTGVNVSTGTVLSARAGAVARTLAAIVDDVIPVSAWGVLGASAATNNVILAAAVAAAGTAGGGDVLLPAGSHPFTTLTLPANVRLVGCGRGVTTLRSLEASSVITAGGHAAGLMDLTLDGTSLLSGSVGLTGIGKNDLFLQNVEIKRFETGLSLKGGTNPRFRDLILNNCVRGGRLRGDLNASGAGGGAAMRDVDWLGGAVTANTVTGLELHCEDAVVEGPSIENVLFDSNTGDALLLVGARSVALRSCRWTNNITNMRVQDGTVTAFAASNTTRGVLVEAGLFSSGELRWDGKCESVVYDACVFAAAAFIASVPTNAIVMRDCAQDAATAATGSTERIMRSAENREGFFSVRTTDATQTTIWQIDLAPGEVARISAMVVGRQANGVNTASYGFEGVITRAGATLDFDFASLALTPGSTVTGTTSGATAVVQAVTGTTSGTMTLRSIVGTFQSGEGLTFSSGQTAQATGSLVTANAALAGVAVVGFDHETVAGYASTLDVSGSQGRVRVTGAASTTMDWTATVKVALGSAI